MDKKIIVTIPQFGAPVVEAVGFQGQGCANATSAIEKALNASGAETRVIKPEWDATEYGEEGQQETLSW